jgi:hypothetical protein
LSRDSSSAAQARVAHPRARTPDAIHLATVELLGQAPALVTILSRDVRIRDNAKALGYALA